MESSTMRAVKFGALLGLIIAGCAVLESVARRVIFAMHDPEDLTGAALSRVIHTETLLMGLVAGLIAGGLVLGLVFSPLWRRVKNDRAIALGIAGGTLLIAVSFMAGIAVLVSAVCLAAMFALGTSRLLTPQSGSAERLGVSLGAIVAMAIGCFVPTLALDMLVGGTSSAGKAAIAFLGTLVLARPMLWVLLRAQHTSAGAAAGMHAPPRGWMWGYLHLRAAGQRAFGFLYVDPMGGPSFHVMADLHAPLNADALRASGYRGASTVRLGAHETLHPTGAGDAFQRQVFEQGGATGTIVLGLSANEHASLGLPPMPPWAFAYAAPSVAA